jgi:CIC family chloride channel protein
MLDRIRLQFAGMEAQPLLALLGIVSGIVTGCVIIIFRYLIELVQAGFLPGADPENYEALSATARFLIPAAGGVVLGLLFSRIDKRHLQTGVVHVLERLANYQGHMPVKNFIVQFIGAALSIISGHSVGREGPGIHLGAASSSLIAQGLQLPNNTVRVLVGCGAAASIAAAFNTPIAGVIFAMEVILMEYTIAGFTPIILATVSATVLTRFIFGDEPAFTVPALQLASFVELPLLLVMGIVIGAISAAFIGLMNITTLYTQSWSIILRLSLAGIFTGLCALLVPQIMGIGYDTVNAAMLGQLGLGVLALIVLFKLVATTIGLGLGLPGGLIGPTMVIGAAAGGVLGLFADTLFSSGVASPGFYAMIGLGAMMGATLQAPLAALMAMLELTINTNIILPGMLVVIVASMTSSQLFKRQGIFMMLLKARGLDLRHDPVAQSLRRIGVASAMDRSFVRSEQVISREQAQAILQQERQWIIIESEGKPESIMLTADLAMAMSKEPEDEIDLMEIPGKRVDSVQINIRATLQQALETMDADQVDVLYIGQTSTAGITSVQGLITRQKIDSYYRY